MAGWLRRFSGGRTRRPPCRFALQRAFQARGYRRPDSGGSPRSDPSRWRLRHPGGSGRAIRAPPEAIAQTLAKLTAPAGVYAVLGNHDWWFDAPRIRSALEAVSIPVLEDRAIPISRDRCHFWLAGVSDWWEGAHDVGRALESVPTDAAVIAFTHNPDVFPEVPQRVTLTIAAHTHGGQVYIPGIGRPVVPSAYGERFAIGHIVEQGRNLFVSSGLGTSILPVRFLVPPEVSVLTLLSPR